MPVKVTRNTFEVLGENLGTVTAGGIGTIFIPFLRNNWVTEVTVDTSWQTEVTWSHNTGSEERTQLRARPVRTIRATVTGMNQAESAAIQLSVMNMGRFEMPFPLYSDRSTCTVKAVADTSNVTCDTKYRRFYPGQRVVFVPFNFTRRSYSGVLATAFYAIIDEVSGNGFTTVDPLDFDVERSDHIYPLIDVHPELKIKTNPISDYHSQVTITALERDGNSTLPPIWYGNLDPYFTYYQGFPILDVKPNWATALTQEYIRLGTRTTQGRATLTTLYGDIPLLHLRYQELNVNREETWQILRFFDACQGRTKPFWLKQFMTLWTPEAQPNATSVDVQNHDYLQNMVDLIDYIALEEADGTLHLKQISSITDEGGFFRMNFTSEPFVSIPTITRITPVWLCRFTSDTFKERWATETISTGGIDARQLQNEKAVTIPNL